MFVDTENYTYILYRFKYNIFDHIGISSTLRSEKSGGFLRYDLYNFSFFLSLIFAFYVFGINYEWPKKFKKCLFLILLKNHFI